jgi:hypothetical protein
VSGASVTKPVITESLTLVLANFVATKELCPKLKARCHLFGLQGMRFRETILNSGKDNPLSSETIFMWFFAKQSLNFIYYIALQN